MTAPERRRSLLHALIVTLIVVGVAVLCIVLGVPGGNFAGG